MYERTDSGPLLVQSSSVPSVGFSPGLLIAGGGVAMVTITFLTGIRKSERSAS